MDPREYARRIAEKFFASDVGLDSRLRWSYTAVRSELESTFSAALEQERAEIASAMSLRLEEIEHAVVFEGAEVAHETERHVLNWARDLVLSRNRK